MVIKFIPVVVLVVEGVSVVMVVVMGIVVFVAGAPAGLEPCSTSSSGRRRRIGETGLAAAVGGGDRRNRISSSGRRRRIGGTGLAAAVGGGDDDP